MDNLVNNVIEGINAALYYFKAAIGFLVTNPIFLGASVFMLLLSWPGKKTFKIGKTEVKG